MVNRDNFLFIKYIEFNFYCYTSFACAAFYVMETGPMQWKQLIQITSQFDLKHKPRTLNQNNDGQPVNKRIYIRCKPSSNNRELRKQNG